MKLCECGCGQTTKLSKHTDNRYGEKKGEPMRFVKGHNRRGHKNTEEHKLKTNRARHMKANADWRAENVGYHGLHLWLNRKFPKTGICQHCKIEKGSRGTRGTHWANITGKYTRLISDYMELCPRCHLRLDRDSILPLLL